MNVSAEYLGARDTFSIPQSHLDLEQEIRRIQAERDPFIQLIPESRLQARIKYVAKITFESLTAVQQIKSVVGIELLADAALAIIQDKDKRRVADPDKRFPRVIKELNESRLGRETMLRVLHVISAAGTVPSKQQPPFFQKNSREQVMQAALFLSAKTCQSQLEQEKAYRCSRLISTIATDWERPLLESLVYPK